MSCSAQSRVYLQETTTRSCPTTVGCPCKTNSFRYLPACPCPIEPEQCNTPVVGITGVLARLRLTFSGVQGVAPTTAELDAAECTKNLIEVPLNKWDVGLVESIFFAAGNTGATVSLAFCPGANCTANITVAEDSPNPASRLSTLTGSTLTLQVNFRDDAGINPGGQATTPAGTVASFFTV